MVIWISLLCSIDILIIIKKLCVIMNKNRNHQAIADLIGTLLILMISVGLFSILYYFVFSIDPPDQGTPPNIIMYSKSDQIILAHWGGDSISMNDLVITLNGNEINISDIDFYDKNNNDILNLGETLNITITENNQCIVNVIDKSNNIILMTGSIKGNES